MFAQILFVFVEKKRLHKSHDLLEFENSGYKKNLYTSSYILCAQ